MSPFLSRAALCPVSEDEVLLLFEASSLAGAFSFSAAALAVFFHQLFFLPILYPVAHN